MALIEIIIIVILLLLMIASKDGQEERLALNSAFSQVPYYMKDKSDCMVDYINYPSRI